MPKLKTNKAAKKRFKLTGTGKIRKTKMNKQHTPSMGKKTTKRKRHLRGLGVVDKTNEKQIKKMLPYM